MGFQAASKATIQEYLAPYEDDDIIGSQVSEIALFTIMAPTNVSVEGDTGRLRGFQLNHHFYGVFLQQNHVVRQPSSTESKFGLRQPALDLRLRYGNSDGMCGCRRWVDREAKPIGCITTGVRLNNRRWRRA